jgi:hypothetical protein
MHGRLVICAVLATVLPAVAQTVHIPDYFPLEEGRRWIYQDEYNQNDTATMSLHVPFAQCSSIALTFSPYEKLFFGADTSGLRMLGQTIPLGTFSFDTPLGIAGLDATVGDNIHTSNWRVTNVPSGDNQYWGWTETRLDRIETGMTVMDSTYDSVLVIGVRYRTGDAEYFLAKGVGIVKMTASGAPTYSNRELVESISSQTVPVRKLWQSSSQARQVRVLSASRELVRLSVAMDERVHVRILSPNGRVLVNQRFRDEDNPRLKMPTECSAGRYILWVRAGSQCMTKSFFISPR